VAAAASEEECGPTVLRPGERPESKRQQGVMREEVVPLVVLVGDVCHPEINVSGERLRDGIHNIPPGVKSKEYHMKMHTA